MASGITAVRAYLTKGPKGPVLPTPELLDLSVPIPYGSRVRFEIEVSEEKYLMPAQGILLVEPGPWVPFLPASDGKTITAELTLPWDLLLNGGGEFHEVTEPVRFPQAGVPPFAEGGDVPMEMGFMAPDGSRNPGVAPFSFSLAAPTAGGSAPRIVSVETGLTDSQVRLGQPWLLRATVEDDDDDVVAVLFSVLQGGMVQWFFLRDDGSCGDEVAGDGVYSFLRVGGDPWERSYIGAGQDVSALLSVQAVDSHGNWSEPVDLKYTTLASQEPIWMEEEAAKGPAITEAGVALWRGPYGRPCVWAKCEEKDVWVCSRTVGGGSCEIAPLFDDGRHGDPAAGDGEYAALVPLPVAQGQTLVMYAVSKDNPTQTGARQETYLAPVR